MASPAQSTTSTVADSPHPPSIKDVKVTVTTDDKVPKSPVSPTVPPSNKGTLSTTTNDAVPSESVAKETTAAVAASSTQPQKDSSSASGTKSADGAAAGSTSSDAEDDDDTPTIDLETFEQILELDEDETHDFSKGMTWQYFSQVGTTFTKMEDALSAQDAEELSALGHFLKGSSAALGVAKVQNSCEKIQHYGHLRDEDRGIDLTKPEALKMIGVSLAKAKKDYVEAEAWLKDWYKNNSVDE